MFYRNVAPVVHLKFQIYITRLLSWVHVIKKYEENLLKWKQVELLRMKSRFDAIASGSDAC